MIHFHEIHTHLQTAYTFQYKKHNAIYLFHGINQFFFCLAILMELWSIRDKIKKISMFSSRVK